MIPERSTRVAAGPIFQDPTPAAAVAPGAIPVAAVAASHLAVDLADSGRRLHFSQAEAAPDPSLPSQPA